MMFTLTHLLVGWYSYDSERTLNSILEASLPASLLAVSNKKTWRDPNATATSSPALPTLIKTPSVEGKAESKDGDVTPRAKSAWSEGKGVAAVQAGVAKAGGDAGN
jgi:hypothetical protein